MQVSRLTGGGGGLLPSLPAATSLLSAFSVAPSLWSPNRQPALVTLLLLKVWVDSTTTAEGHTLTRARHPSPLAFN